MQSPQGNSTQFGNYEIPIWKWILRRFKDLALQRINDIHRFHTGKFFADGVVEFPPFSSLIQNSPCSSITVSHWNYCPPDSGLQYLYWFFVCWLNDPEWLKLLLQCGQRNGFSPLCRRSCSVRWCLCLKAFLQTSQTNGRWPAHITRPIISPLYDDNGDIRLRLTSVRVGT